MNMYEVLLKLILVYRRPLSACGCSSASNGCIMGAHAMLRRLLFRLACYSVTCTGHVSKNLLIFVVELMRAYILIGKKE